MIRRDAIHISSGCGHSPEEIAAAHHESKLNPFVRYLGHFRSQSIDAFGIDAE
jgi:hypothetical protein